ncbi:ATP phosphoribosyltransferase regulatory subunit [Butyrivibrio sp. DSM 10294]|uniref:ATP phosphoribosyltransferase regulatory subunit n=1 Tax=Butyrivibrio sp. DSM 10294 TaxID=2972457 RepID=UPI00234E844E|nr:ATP phosphoribosyltransferase regulatory subunit [Butyrivibrio sp. DSM 10294]MDC7295250.1 ATP phosphoribosyltransferase regulatory subunit [Butyrivibrio sp. DSM 10294]
MTKVLLHTPDGVRDIYGRECSDRILVKEKIHDKMKLFGYEDMETPTFEFFDVFAEEINASDARELYKFFDKEGNTLVLRPDFTPSVARCASKSMLENGTPIRVVYQGKSFLNTSNLQGKLKENYDIGVELFNDDSVYADAEMIALLIESLKSSGLTDFQVSIGDADYYKGICEEAGIDAETESLIREQIVQKNYFAAESIMVERNIQDKYRNLLVKVSEFIGSDEALDNAEKEVSNKRSLSAIRRLKSLYGVLKEYNCSQYVSFDLGMLSKFNYYTGVIFSAYTYGVGDAIAKGGRYDSLLGKYGKDAPAIGFVIILDDLISALYRQNVEIEHEDEVVILEFDENSFEAQLSEAADLRKSGQKVALCYKKG